MKIWGLALFCAAALSSCQRNTVEYQPWRPPVGSENLQSVEDAPESELMAKIERIAILPFVDYSRSIEHNLSFSDLLLFGEQFASHLTGSETFKAVMYPQEALQKLEGTELSMLRPDDLKEIGNFLDVDAILYGVVHQYSMYYPPKLSISMKFYLTRAERFATINEISVMAHVGMPINQYNPTFFRQLWDKSAFYDGRSNHVQELIEHMLKTHTTGGSGFDSQRFLRTKRDFIDLISYDLASSLDSGKHAEENAFVAPPSLKGKRTHSMPSGYYHR
jgi:hypothetical protein